MEFDFINEIASFQTPIEINKLWLKVFQKRLKFENQV